MPGEVAGVNIVAQQAEGTDAIRPLAGFPRRSRGVQHVPGFPCAGFTVVSSLSTEWQQSSPGKTQNRHASKSPFQETPSPTGPRRQGAQHKTFDATEHKNVYDNSVKSKVLPGRTDRAGNPKGSKSRSIHRLGFAGRGGRRREFLPFPAFLNTRANILSTFFNCRRRSKACSICWAGTRVVISLSVSTNW